MAASTPAGKALGSSRRQAEHQSATSATHPNHILAFLKKAQSGQVNIPPYLALVKPNLEHCAQFQAATKEADELESPARTGLEGLEQTRTILTEHTRITKFHRAGERDCCVSHFSDC